MPLITAFSMFMHVILLMLGVRLGFTESLFGLSVGVGVPAWFASKGLGFCRIHNLDSSSASKCMNGKAKQIKGYRFRRITNEEYEEYIKLINEKGSTTILK